MTTSTPFSLIVAAASDPQVGTDRLLRAALVLATAIGDQVMVGWCNSELQGYKNIPLIQLPEYRKLSARVMATDHYGRHIPVVLGDPESAKNLELAPFPHSVAELLQMASSKQGASFQVWFPPDLTASLLKSFPGSVDLFRVVQKMSIDVALEAIRQHVFDWAIPSLSAPVATPQQINLEAILGITFSGAPRVVAAPMEAQVTPGFSLTIASLSNSAVNVNSPGSTSTVTQQTTTDVEALRGLVSALAEAIAQGKMSNPSDGAFAEVEGTLSELRALSTMPAPKWEWVVQSAGSLKMILEQAAGGIVANIATPQVVALLAQVLKS